MISLAELAKKCDLPPDLLSLQNHYGVSSLVEAYAAYLADDLHLRCGGVFGDLGAPIGAVEMQPNGDAIQKFQLGRINIPSAALLRPLDIAPAAIGATRTIAAQVELQGVHCFGTEDPGGSDEVFAIISVYSINPNGIGEDKLVSTFRTNIQENVNPGLNILTGYTVSGGNAVVFSGSGLRIHVLLMEHEYGDPDELKERIQAALEAGARKGAEMLAKQPLAGVGGAAQDFIDLDIGGFKPFKALLGGVSSVLADWLGDDLIGGHEFVIPAAVFAEWASQRTEINGSVHYPRWEDSFKKSSPPPNLYIPINWPRANDEPLFNLGGGTYKVYFKITPVFIEIPVAPNVNPNG